MSDINSTLDELSKQERDIIQKNADLRKKELNALIEKANETAKNTSRAAQIDYKNYINPYGRQAEILNEAGLGSSSLSETNRAKAYNAYQNRLAEAADTAAQTISGINDDLTDLAIQTDANLLESKAEDAYRQLEQYWKNLEWNYQKERDAVEDARYEKEWALKLAQQAASGSKSSSSSRSSSSRSSSSSKTSSSSSSSGGFDLSSLSNLESYVLEGAQRDEADIQKYMDIAEAFGTVKELPNYYPQLGALLSQAAMNGATEAELNEIVNKWKK